MAESPPVPVYMRRDGFEPIGELARLRAEAPVTKIDLAPGFLRRNAWLITRYEDVREVLSDATRFSNVPRPAPGDDDEQPLTVSPNALLPNCDPPEHTRLRKMVAPAFTAKRMRLLRPRVEAIVEERLDVLEASNRPVDLVSEWAEPIPALVIAELLGVPYDDALTFLGHMTSGQNRKQSSDERGDSLAAARSLMASLVSRQRTEPGDGVLGMLVRDHGHELTEEELRVLGSLLMLAGYDNTASMLALGVLVLLRHPDQLALLLEQPEYTKRAVDELLRYLSIVHAPTPRWPVEDLKLGGQEIKAGEMMLCAFSSANRDEILGDNLNRFDITRASLLHFGLVHGVHFCLGAPLAKLEMEIAYPALFRRFPTLRLATSFEKVPFRDRTPTLGLDALPVTW